MNISLNKYYRNYHQNYKSSSQITRVITEKWFDDNMYCPFCSSSEIKAFSNNYPVADFYCNSCKEVFQLKAKKNSIGEKVLDGEYNTMIKAIKSNSAPNFFFLAYAKDFYSINSLIIVPKEFILPNIIQKRKPLSIKARRAGWTGCNILLDGISNQGKIYAIKEQKIIDKSEVINNVLSIGFLRKIKNTESRGWINDMLLIIAEIKSNVFKLEDVYKFSCLLKKLHPNNNNIEAKIRQQLQILRDHGIIEFLGKGVYKKNDKEEEMSP